VRFIIAIVSLFAFSTIAHANQVCIAGSQQEFEDYVVRKNFKTFELDQDNLLKLKLYINAMRAKQGSFLLEFDGFSFSKVAEGKIGFVMFYKGCVVPGTVMVVKFEDFAGMMESAGIPPSAFSQLTKA